jgi:transposase
MTARPAVGVDVANDRLDVAVRPSGETWSAANDEAGITALVARLRPLGPALIVCEATGGFERRRSRR